MQKIQNVILDFSHIYPVDIEKQADGLKRINLSDIDGTDMYCTKEAEDEIRKLWKLGRRNASGKSISGTDDPDWTGSGKISIDKDVLNRYGARTNWNQGSMSVDTLKKLLSEVFMHQKVIGVDICGECSLEEPWKQLEEDQKINEVTNDVLYHFLSSNFPYREETQEAVMREYNLYKRKRWMKNYFLRIKEEIL